MPSTPRRFSTAAGLSVWTTMPSAAGVAQAGSSFPWPSTETRQMRQLPTVGSFGYQQRVGISTPCARAASRMVSPSAIGTDCPLIVSEGIVWCGPGEEGMDRVYGALGLAARGVRLESSQAPRQAKDSCVAPPVPPCPEMGSRAIRAVSSRGSQTPVGTPRTCPGPAPAPPLRWPDPGDSQPGRHRVGHVAPRVGRTRVAFIRRELPRLPAQYVVEPASYRYGSARTVPRAFIGRRTVVLAAPGSRRGQWSDPCPDVGGVPWVSARRRGVPHSLWIG